MILHPLRRVRAYFFHVIWWTTSVGLVLAASPAALHAQSAAQAGHAQSAAQAHQAQSVQALGSGDAADRQAAAADWARNQMPLELTVGVPDIVYDLRIGDELRYRIVSGSDWRVRIETREVLRDPLATSFVTDMSVLSVGPERMTLQVVSRRGRIDYHGPGLSWSVRVRSGRTSICTEPPPPGRALARALEQRPDYDNVRQAAEIACVDEQSIGIGLGLLCGRVLVVTVPRGGGPAEVGDLPVDVLERFPVPDRQRVERLLRAHLSRSIGLVFPPAANHVDAAQVVRTRRRSQKRAPHVSQVSMRSAQDESYSFAGTHLWDDGTALAAAGQEAARLVETQGTVDGSANHEPTSRFDLGFVWGPLRGGRVERIDGIRRLRGSGIVSQRDLQVVGEATTRLSSEVVDENIRRVRTLVVRSALVWQARLEGFNDGGGRYVEP